MKTPAKFASLLSFAFLNLFIIQWYGFLITGNETEASWDDTSLSDNASNSDAIVTQSPTKMSFNGSALKSHLRTPSPTVKTTKPLRRRKFFRRARFPVKYRPVAKTTRRAVVKQNEPHIRSKKVLIVSYMRSGSTFLGALIQSAPDVFYSFEPLGSIKELIINEVPEQSEISTKLIKLLLQCKFPSSYFRYLSTKLPGESIPYLMAHNTRVSDMCHVHRSVCQHSESYSSACKKFGIHLVKNVRLRMSWVRRLIEESPGDEFKIIYLVRDPRGVMASRQHTGWCRKRSCMSSLLLCNQMKEDLEEFNKLNQMYPNTFYKVKLEELTANVHNETEKLFRFLGMNVTSEVRNFIETHTNSEGENETHHPHSTVRNSTAVATAWRKKLSHKMVTSIERTCSSVLKALNYKYGKG